MKTRLVDLPAGFSFEYSEAKHPLPHQWHVVASPELEFCRFGCGDQCKARAQGCANECPLGDRGATRAGEPLAWASTAKRDRARACFTRRRSVAAAMEDLKRARLIQLCFDTH